MKLQAIPAAPEALTADWLTDALRSTGTISKARVTSATPEVIGAGSGFIGQLARVALEYDTPEDGAPRSLIGKFPTLDPGGRGIGNLFRFYEREVRFYEEVAARSRLRVPRAYFTFADVPGDQYLLLLEDMAGTVGDQLAGCKIEAAKLAIGSIAEMHAAWWQSPELGALEWMPWVDAPVHQSAEGSYQEAWVPFSTRYGPRLTPKMLAVADELQHHVIDVLHQLEPAPRTLMHGDFRLDNLFFGPGKDDFAVCDWQISTKGRGMFDVTYFILGDLSPEDRRAHQMELLHLWHDILRERGVKDYSFDQALEDYRLSTLYCLVYVVISLGTLDPANARGLALMDAWLERCTSAIEDLDAAAVMPK